MYQFSFLLSVSLLFMMSSCDQNTSSSSSKVNEEKIVSPSLLPTDILYNEIMKIHDDVMPKVKDINRLQKSLKDELETPKASTNKDEINSILQQLDLADKGMWDWMGAFKQPNKNSPQDSIVQYLQQEKISISKVSEDMLNSITTAKKYLEK